MKISGTFDVNLNPVSHSQKQESPNMFGRLLIDKTFHGDLDATSKGEMISLRTPVKGSAGYVAIEQVVGSLEGKKGGFALQHFGIMDANGQRLILEIIPNSGFDELETISGKMDILIKDGAHFYEFEYEFA